MPLSFSPLASAVLYCEALMPRSDWASKSAIMATKRALGSTLRTAAMTVWARFTYRSEVHFSSKRSSSLPSSQRTTGTLRSPMWRTRSAASPESLSMSASLSMSPFRLSTYQTWPLISPTKSRYSSTPNSMRGSSIQSLMRTDLRVATLPTEVFQRW